MDWVYAIGVYAFSAGCLSFTFDSILSITKRPLYIFGCVLFDLGCVFFLLDAHG